MAVEVSRYLPRSTVLDRFDGSKWRVYDVDGGHLVLTQNGQHLLSKNPSIASALRTYRDEALNPVVSPIIRRPFRHGGNSDVYDVGDTGLVIKEAGNEQSIWFALERLDYLYGICEQSLPPHIRVPEHLGALFSKNLDKQFLLMEKINNGLTIQDVVDDGSEPEKAKIVETAFEGAKLLLDEAIVAHATDDGYPHSLLVDWHEGNVIVDFAKPAGDYPFTLYIIDQ